MHLDKDVETAEGREDVSLLPIFMGSYKLPEKSREQLQLETDVSVQGSFDWTKPGLILSF